MRRIVIFAMDGCQSLDVAGPLEVFYAASELIHHQARARSPSHATDFPSQNTALPTRKQPAPANARKASAYRVEIVALRRGAIRCESGLVLHAGRSARAALRSGPIDTLLVAGGMGMRRAARQRQTLDAVRTLAKGARRVGSVCTGAFVLAAAGLLDGRSATTHWAFCDTLASEYSGIRVERSPIFVRDGRVWTSAGVTAGIDLALSLVEADFGRELAAAVARWLVVFVRRAGGQSQFSTQLAALSTEREPLRELTAWIAEHPEQSLRVPELARRVGMSPRHFSRVFHDEIGMSPATYVEAVRLETARRLLESSERSVDEVAQCAGFTGPEGLRRAMSRRIGLSPKEYRARFGARSSKRALSSP